MESTSQPGGASPDAGKAGSDKGDTAESVRVTPTGSPRQRQGRWPTSSYLPGFTSKVASRTCPKCGFEAFAYAEKCRCGASLSG